MATVAQSPAGPVPEHSALWPATVAACAATAGPTAGWMLMIGLLLLIHRHRVRAATSL